MNTVWTAFGLAALGLSTLALVAFRWRGSLAPALRTAGRNLMLLAAATALFPLLLPHLGPPLWVAAYILLVAVTAGVTTGMAISRTRRQSGSEDRAGLPSAQRRR